MSDLTSRLAPLAEELLENDYARDNLREGGEKIRDAYDRARKRRVKPSTDRKLRRQVEAALAALDEGTAALASGRRKPKRTGRKLLGGALILAAAGATAAVALDEGLRNRVLGSAKALGEEIAGSPAAGDGPTGGAS